MSARGNAVIPAYFDHAATSPMRQAALEAFVRHSGVIGNPSALHVAGQRARRVLEESREQLAEAVSADPVEVVFCSGGSEADSIAVVGGRNARRAEGRHRVLVSAVEHPAVAGVRDHGGEVIQVTGDGLVELGGVAQAIDTAVAVVSVMAVNNETGIIQPLSEIRDAAHRHGAWFHTDAVQALGHIRLSFRDSGADLMSISAHKVGGPVGIGALLVRRATTPSSIGLGGGQERHIRSGTGMVALAAAFAAAASQAVNDLAAELARLECLRAEIEAIVKACGGRINGAGAKRAPHIVNATFDAVRADDVLFGLDARGVYASVGSACRAGVHQPSQVLLAMGRSTAEASASLRFSLGHTSSPADVEALAAALPASVRAARAARGAG
ncbi:MAG: cysteine desulfurase family protein [Arachnia sp.]